jgi:hypothetical protein
MKKLKSQGFRQTENGPVLKEYLHIYIQKNTSPRDERNYLWSEVLLAECEEDGGGGGVKSTGGGGGNGVGDHVGRVHLLSARMFLCALLLYSVLLYCILHMHILWRIITH